jgi:hypothetical protein
MSEERLTKYWDGKQWRGKDENKEDRLITLRKLVLNDAAKRQRENIVDLEYAKHLLDQPFEYER